MRIIALETSTELGSCALWCDGVITERICPIGIPHSETLLPLVRKLLTDSGYAIGQCDAIAFGVGPGAFTGLRVACGAAQGLAVAADLPLVPVTSLETLAATAGGDHVLALLDARMGEVYCGSYRKAKSAYRLLGEITLAAPGMVSLPEGSPESGPEGSAWQACGNALAAYPALADRLLAAGMQLVTAPTPMASIVAQLAAPRAARGEWIDAALAVPLYIRDKVAKTVSERLGEGGRA